MKDSYDKRGEIDAFLKVLLVKEVKIEEEMSNTFRTLKTLS